ncbi:MAG: N-acetyltransferase [Oscillospiraceae bacterium]|nr:N-acetyltransferase [Oscillospiraceae bacterium]
MIIRAERPADYAEVYRLVRTAFATVCRDGAEPDEQDYLEELRGKDAFIPELSLVAELDDGTLVGQIVLYKTAITTPEGELTELLLSPICVHPDYVRRGIARTMVAEALRVARGLGFRAVFLCGDSEIYGRLGFLPSYRYGIFHQEDASLTAEWSMVRELYPGALDGVRGVVDTV